MPEKENTTKEETPEVITKNTENATPQPTSTEEIKSTDLFDHSLVDHPFVFDTRTGEISIRPTTRTFTLNLWSYLSPLNTNSATAFVVEQDGVHDNVLVIDTTNGRVGINTVPAVPFDVLGNAQIDGSLTVKDELIVNEDGGNVDTRMEGDTDTSAFFLDASADSIGIGTNAPGSKLDVNGFIRTVGQKRTTADFNRTDTTLTNITNLSVNVVAGKSYTFKAKLFISADATGGHGYAISGTCTATNIVYSMRSINDSTVTWLFNDRFSALNGSRKISSGSTDCTTDIEGLITVANAGTLTVQFSQFAANGTSSVLLGSYFIVEELA